MLTSPAVGRLIGESVLVEETQFGIFQTRVRTGSSTFLTDEPMGTGGGLGSGPNPYDLLCAAIGSCLIMTIRMFARENKMPLDRVKVRVTRSCSDNDERGQFMTELQLEGSLSSEETKKLASLAENSPVRHILSKGAKVETILRSPGSIDDSAITHCDHLRHIAALCDRRDATVA